MAPTGTRTGADLFLEALSEYGVTRLFGNPGTTELPLMTALSDSEIEYVLGLHEDIAVGMAAGYATRRRYHAHHDADVNPLGVVNLHLAPGLAHGLGNLYDGETSGAPLLITTGDHSTDFRHEEPILGGDTVRMARQFTKWSAAVERVEALPTMVRRAVRTALTPPTGPVFLALPLDVMTEETDAEPERLGDVPNAGRGDPSAIDRATDALADADEPVFVVGDQIARSGKDAVAATVDLAEAAGAAVYGEIAMAEANFPTDHDQWVGWIPSSEDVAASIMDADTLAFVGCSTNTTLTRHERDLVPDDATLVHVGLDGWELGKNVPADVSALGDPGSVAAEIAPRLADRLPDEVRQRRLRAVERRREKKREATAGEDEREAPGLSKTALARALYRATPDAYVVNEGVTAGGALRDEFTFGPEQFASTKGGGLGYGLPAAVGAAIAGREAGSDRDVVGFVGDGSYLYYPHTLYSAARYDVDLTVVVPDNRNYRILKDNTLKLFGGTDEDYDYVGMDFEPPVDLVGSAAAHGADGEFVDDDDVDAALGRALSRDGPYVLDVLIHD